VLTDGDFRRWLVEQSNIDLNRPVSAAMNRAFVSCSENEPAERIEERMSERIAFVPLVDRQIRLVAVASRRPAQIRIGEFTIDADSPAFVIAEIGNNHNGSLELAIRLIDEAIAAGADCAKFQMRRMDALYRNAGDADDVSADLGAQYTLDLLARFQLTDEQMFAAFDHCKTRGILPLCTPWDRDSLAALERYGMVAYKVASADLTNHELIEALAATRKPLIVSTGMSSESEIRDSVRLLKRLKAQYMLLHVNSTYPAPFKDIHLKYMGRLAQIGECPVGYSGHERGIAVPIAAVARGAKVIEKHLTIDRSMEGNDHRVSLLPAEFAAMVQGIREVEEALGSGEERRITQGELMNREVLGKSLVAARAIAAGDVIHEDSVSIRSPGQGLSPYRRHELIGRRATRALSAGDFFFPSDLDDGGTGARHYRFRRPFGIPVRYHDARRMLPTSNFDLLEFHLSYKDMEVDPGRFLDERHDLDFVVHAPELFAGDHVMDLCSDDEDYRRRSIAELQRVVDITRSLKPRFAKATRPMIIINAGGFSMDGPLPVSRRPALYDRIAESLARVDTEGVEIIPQTMPPFPWHFGGQRFHNLFVDAEDIVAFCARTGHRICLDISHSKLACNHRHASFKTFLEQVGPLTAHMHVVDAAGVDGEGLQIGEGDIDFAMVGEVLDRVAPRASFIPEIWQGHKDNGAGFWLALERLELWLGQR
jgi:N-acetylneuraminate synthase